MKPLLLLTTFFCGIIYNVIVTGASEPTGSIKAATFKSPAITLGPGDVSNKIYYKIPFVSGHIALKGFDAELVDEEGDSVPLNEVYLHHWVAVNYVDSRSNFVNYSTTVIGNDGVCPGHLLVQLFGLGAETRHTNTTLPGQYGIEVGTYEDEAWVLNVHAIDTRGTVDPMGCTECRCSLYNVSVDESGLQLQDEYIGGLKCCRHGTHCQLKEGYTGNNRTYYLQYTVHYIDWDETILPVKVYILDATYDGSVCKIEYDVPLCSDDTECQHIKETDMEIPVGGDVIYAVAHQHAGGIGAAIYGQDGREICISMPQYGTGKEAGNEAGYIVGMSTCYPDPGSLQVLNGEKLYLQSNYSGTSSHTGVMGLGYIVVYPGSGNAFVS